MSARLVERRCGCVFFFQAEDGIRDGHVTGVQTCALPIFIASFLATTGFAVFLYAMERAGAGVAVTLRNTSILFAQIIGVVMGDRPKRLGIVRSEERRVGKECRSRRATIH